MSPGCAKVYSVTKGEESYQVDLNGLDGTSKFSWSKSFTRQTRIDDSNDKVGQLAKALLAKFENSHTLEPVSNAPTTNPSNTVPRDVKQTIIEDLRALKSNLKGDGELFYSEKKNIIFVVEQGNNAFYIQDTKAYARPPQEGGVAVSLGNDGRLMINGKFADDVGKETLDAAHKLVDLIVKKSQGNSNVSDASLEKARAEVYFASKMDGIKPIEVNFTTDTPIEKQREAHEGAKVFLKKALRGIGGTVTFVKPSERIPPELKDVEIKQDLNPAIFSWENTQGVQEDIQRDSKKDDGVVRLYGVASQFNGCEATGKYTLEPGKAVGTYKFDPTQGPKAQLAFGDHQVELINAAGNLGYNGLCNVLDAETQDAIGHGYLTPNSDNADQVIEQLRTQGHEAEYSCIGNVPVGGKAPVHQILISAAAFGVYKDRSLPREKQHEVEFLCALHGFRAQFQQALKFASDGKQVVLKPVAVGVGAFGNDPAVVSKAFYVAAKEFQDIVESGEDKSAENVRVQFQVFRGTGEARKMANNLGLEEFKES